MKVKLKYSLADTSGNVSSLGDATAELDDEKLMVTSFTGVPFIISLRDVTSLREAEYRIQLDLKDGKLLALFNLGFKYEDLVRSLFRAVNELEMKDLLMGERLLKQGVPAEVESLTSTDKKELGKCEVRLYETAILIMPERLGLVRLRYGDVLIAEIVDYHLQVKTESGDRLRFSKLGRELEPLHKGIVAAVAGISSSAQMMVKEAFPEADMIGVKRAGELLKDGRSARRIELEEACPGLWKALEMRLSGYGLGEEYAFLQSISRPDLIRIGMKRPLHAQEAQDYVFFLAPIFSSARQEGGNAIAFESSSEEGEGRATYFFRIWGRNEYQDVAEEGMMEHADAVGRGMVKGLEAVNFRREPIYLADDALLAPERSHYRYAILRIPELRQLRERFIGRVIHSTPEQWRQDVNALLKFNVTEKNDSTVWRRSDEGQ